jgi:transposase-like protein
MTTRRSFTTEFKLAAATSHGVEAELKRLREENRQLKMEREILKKVAPGSSGEGDVS